MSVAATWIAMGYLPIARSDRYCVECAKSEQTADGLCCTQGRFHVHRTGGCKSFAAATPSCAAEHAAQGAQVAHASPAIS